MHVKSRRNEIVYIVLQTTAAVQQTMKSRTPSLAAIVKGTLEDVDPEGRLITLLNQSGLSVEEFYTFAHYVRRVARSRAAHLLDDSESDLRCSFCLRTRGEANAMVQGPNAAICDRCIEGALGTMRPGQFK